MKVRVTVVGLIILLIAYSFVWATLNGSGGAILAFQKQRPDSPNSSKNLTETAMGNFLAKN